MIKNLLFASAFSLTIMGSAMAQCTPNQIYAQEPPGLWPDSVTNLPIAGTLSPGYSTVIDIKTLTDTTTVQSGQTVPVKVLAMKIHQVDGLPANFTYQTSYGTNANGWVNGGTFPNITPVLGCAVIQGSQSAVQAALTVNNGFHPLIVTIDMQVRLNVGGFWTSASWLSASNPGSMPIADRYRIKVEEGYTSIQEINTNVFSVEQNYPNPFGTNTTFTFYNPKNNVVNFRVFNMLGKEVYAQAINGNQGHNNFILDGSKLSAGVYICSFDNGSEVITKRITVDNSK
jgi:hypothetical protein